MGTKNNPGAFDCYANAAPDEPMLIRLKDGELPCVKGTGNERNCETLHARDN